MTLSFARAGGVVHVVEDVDAKLAWRASLPGASTYDRAADALRRLQAAGAPAIELLPLALPASWMVNAKATSRAMQRWLEPPLREAWEALLAIVAFDLAPDGWLALAADEREAARALVTALANAGDGASLAAVTKVLALVRPQLVPLMDDAAIAFALDERAQRARSEIDERAQRARSENGAVTVPDTADRPLAPASLFVPMLDWFATTVVDRERDLVAIASRHTRAVLDAAQTLDRVLWIESWGVREMPR